MSGFANVLADWKLDLLIHGGAIKDIEAPIECWGRWRNSPGTDEAIDVVLT